MIDTQITRATCEIKCGHEIGTGWLVSPFRVITARHCVYDAISEDAQISLRFELDSGSDEVSARVIAEDETLDVCVLLLDREIDLPPILLGEALPIEGSQFTAFGFPVAKLSIGHRLEGSISRVLDTPRLNMDLDLHVDAAAGLTDYKGISGAALICDDRCRGMLRLAVDRSLGAISVARMASFLQEHSIPLDEIPEVALDDQELASREEFTTAFDSLVNLVPNGYAFIEGAHGIGKSTFCENYRPRDQSLEHFGTYSFASLKNTVNVMQLAQPEVFFDWLNTLVSSHFTGKAGRVSVKSYPELITEAERLLQMIGREYSAQGKKGVLFVDGLDEVSKLGVETLERFVGLLPSRMPTGLVLVVAAPNYANLSATLSARIGSHSCIVMPSLTHGAARAFCINTLLPERASAEVVRIICDRAQGHPLYLRYLIDLANEGTNAVELSALPLINGNIRNYYEMLWFQLIVDSEAVSLLATIARLRWGISTQQLVDVLTEAERMILVTTLTRIQHLLLRRDETTIYHSSFADFLIEKTELRELDVQHRLALYCMTHSNTHYGKLNVIYHGLRSGATQEADTIEICKQDWVDQCVILGVEPDVLLGDVDEALAAATRQGSFVEVIRLLLLAQRLQFRYDTLFAQSADLIADALISLGKTQEALQHATRYGQLIVPVHVALRLAHQLNIANEATTALELLDKAEAVIEKQLASPSLTIEGFINLFELKIQLLLLKTQAGDEDASKALQVFYFSSLQTMKNGVSDHAGCQEILCEMIGDYLASLMCLNARYISASIIRQSFSVPPEIFTQLLLQLLGNYRVYCQHFTLTPDQSLLGQVFADLRILLDQIDREWDRSGLGLIDAIIQLGAPTDLISFLAEEDFRQLGPLPFIKTDNITIDEQQFNAGMAKWRLASLLDKNLPCPDSAELHPARWKEVIDSICRSLAWCDGAARRAKECNDKYCLQSTWLLLEQRVFESLRFTLEQRVKWEDSYAIPETVFPHIYERLTRLIADVFPKRIDYMLTFIKEQFSVQCGLYSEGFRNVLSKVFDGISRLPLEPTLEDQAYTLLVRWRSFVQENLKNRHELVPELLIIIPLFVRLNASEEAHRTYQATLAVSMGPSWYKEDQLGLMTEALLDTIRGISLESYASEGNTSMPYATSYARHAVHPSNCLLKLPKVKLTGLRL